ncbi:MAG: hypothetical protein M3Y56_09590 [Armatimonadota bacterium]|nr:hypothetical protein [Armatimonadota bacterium]
MPEPSPKPDEVRSLVSQKSLRPKTVGMVHAGGSVRVQAVRGVLWGYTGAFTAAAMIAAMNAGGHLWVLMPFIIALFGASSWVESMQVQRATKAQTRNSSGRRGEKQFTTDEHR